MATTMVHVRIDEDVKDQANDALTAMGLTMSAAVTIFLKRIAVEKALPFDIRVPNAETAAAMAEAERMLAERRLRFATAEALLDDVENSTKR